MLCKVVQRQVSFMPCCILYYVLFVVYYIFISFLHCIIVILLSRGFICIMSYVYFVYIIYILSLQLNQIVNNTKHPHRHVAFALQKPFKEELERLQQQDIITPLGIDETGEWCKSFVLIPKPNGKVRICLDPARLNKVLIRPVHRGLTLNDIFSKLNNVKYLSLIDVSSGYHNLKLDERLSYLTFACQFGGYKCKRLSFGAATTGDMFQ